MEDVDNANSIYQSPILLADDMPNLLVASTTGCDIKYMIKYKYNHVDHHYNVTNCVQMMNNGLIYKLEQFHLHQPSEHVINGKRSELELHFVFKSGGGTSILVRLFGGYWTRDVRDNKENYRDRGVSNAKVNNIFFSILDCRQRHHLMLMLNGVWCEIG